jgi:hypothetical protein
MFKRWILISVLSVALCPAHAADTSGDGPSSPQRGTFIPPEFLPKRVHISDQEMQRYRMERNLGLRPPEEVASFEKIYLEQLQPITVQTSAGIVIANPNNLSDPIMYPRVEK